MYQWPNNGEKSQNDPLCNPLFFFFLSTNKKIGKWMRKIPKAKVQRNFPTRRLCAVRLTSIHFFFEKRKQAARAKRRTEKNLAHILLVGTMADWSGTKTLPIILNVINQRRRKKEKKNSVRECGTDSSQSGAFYGRWDGPDPGVDQRVLLLGDTTQHNFS